MDVQKSNTSYNGDARLAVCAAAFPQARDDVRDGRLDVEAATQLALDMVDSFFPEASVALAYGSAFSGQYRPYSDIDIVVALPNGNFVKNNCFMHNGVPVDLHVFGEDAVTSIVSYAKRSGNASVLLPAAFGRILIDRHGKAAALQRQLAEDFASGPDPAPDDLINNLRWLITNQLVDLCNDLDHAEKVAAGLTLHNFLIQIFFLQSRSWRHRGKWAARNMETALPGLLQRIQDSFSILMTGDALPLISLSAEILEKAGGPLWAGHQEMYAFKK